MTASQEAENLFFLLDHPTQDVSAAVKPEAAKRCVAGFTAKRHPVACWQAERRDEQESGIIFKKQCPET